MNVQATQSVDSAELNQAWTLSVTSYYARDAKKKLNDKKRQSVSGENQTWARVFEIGST